MPEPTMAKLIVSDPPAALASRMAWRNDPAPESLAFVTVKVAAIATPESVARNSEARNARPGRVKRM